MDNILIFVHHKGEWNQNIEYVDFEPMGILVRQDCDYKSLLEILSQQLNINHMSTCLEIKYQVKDNYPPIRITDNGNLSFYLELKKKAADCMMYPLCISFKSYEKEMAFFESTFNISNADIQSGQQSANASKSTYEVDTTSEKQRETISDVINYAKFLTGRFENDEDEAESSFIGESVITDPKHGEIREGQYYKNKYVLKSVLSFYAINNHFQFKVRRSCDRQYFLSCCDPDCSWKLNASRKGKTQIFIIRKLNINHNCSMYVRTSDQRQATSNVIGQFIKSKYINLKTVYKPADILRDMKDDYGIKMNYSKAYRSKAVAQEMVRGKADESFSLLPSYLYMLMVTNPGSFVKLEVNDDDSFLYVFMALNASIKGWQFCIPVFAVDGTFLTSAYGGTLLTACAQDGNGKIFPLAFCVVDSENDASWEWFMRRIRDAFQMQRDMCIVSDRHESIKNAAAAVFPEATHALCTFHLYNNIKKNFKKSSKELREAFYGAAKAYTKEAFDYYMKELDSMCRGLKTYLESVKYKKWARAHCENNRYKVMTTNIAESMNSRIRAGKDLPVTTLLEYLRTMVQEWSYANRHLARSTFTALSKRAEDILNENYINSLKLVVSNSNDNIKTVFQHTTKFIVDLKERTCTCRRFQIDDIPCPHAMAILKEMNQDPYKFCSDYFTKETILKTYEETVYPVEDQNTWNVPEEVAQKIVTTPHGRTKSGRPRKQRIKSRNETRGHSKCSRCQKYGHNVKTCKNMPTKN
ncbi:uncharacterized protein LOC126661549 [Mercurialis annua]|uniref:uncharacterized protein LOC126661549 n=1 Tax=Mercurialis annua TaxID=3986 RepID=UPI0024AF2B25|nr:uncharacterized protein LOC126661549 [Mercurialis annua]